MLSPSPERTTPTESALALGSVLVVSPSFFGYEHDIVAAFRDEGADVRLLDERPGNSSLLRAALRLRLRWTRALVNRHFQRAADELRDRPVDLVLVIKGESTPAWFLRRLRDEHPGVVLVYYSYDRMPDGDNCHAILPLFDRAYSFDPADVERHGLRYKALFHGPMFRSDIPLENRRYDLSFIGTAHSERYRFVASIAAGTARRFLFFYSPARWFLAVQKLARRPGGRVPWRDVSFEKLSKDRVAQVFGDSRAVLDLQRPGQTGLTMRTFEVLASGARLITTNEAVRSLECYDPAEILVVGQDHGDETRERVRAFLQAPRATRPDVAAHSLRRWVRSFVEED